MSGSNGAGTTVPPVPGHMSGAGRTTRPIDVLSSRPAGSEIAQAILTAAEGYEHWRAEDALSQSELVGRVVDAIWGTLRSPNNYDPNGEAANVVDGLYEIGRAIHHLARAVEDVRTSQGHDDYHDPVEEMHFPEPENRGRARLSNIPDELVAPHRPAGRGRP